MPLTIMSKVIIHARNDLLTPYDLRTRVNVVSNTDHSGDPKKIFSRFD